jgi:histidinol phosphatase-like PHP family hydrolase
MQEKFLKIDMHVHTKGVSKCSIVAVKDAIDFKKADGYDGFVLTNHCQSHYYPPSRHAEYIEGVIEEFERAKAYGAKRGFKVFLGLEVTVFDPFYSDWLLYGVTEAFLRSTPCLYKLTQRELYKLCHDTGVLLVQAHPYRSNTGYCEDMKPGYADALDGLEINCTHGDFLTKDKVLRWAKERGKLVTCGMDYHGPSDRVKGGTFLPDWVNTSVDIAKYLKETSQTELFFGAETLTVSK